MNSWTIFFLRDQCTFGKQKVMMLRRGSQISRVTPNNNPIPLQMQIGTSRYMGFPGEANGKESTCQCRRHQRCRFDPQVWKIPWSRKCNPLQCSCLENPTDRGAWWATVRGVTESVTTEDLRVIRERTSYFVALNDERQRLKELQEKTIEYVWNPKSRRHEKLEK